MPVKTRLRAALRALGLEVKRYHPDFPAGCVSLPAASTPAKGRVLIAYILEPFLRPPGTAVSSTHTHHIESLLMAQVWQELGYAVDVIDYRNGEFIPRKRYDFFVSARTNLEVIAKRLNPDCVKIAHFDTMHFAFNNHASYARLLDLQRRRAISLPRSMRLIEHNLALESTDYAVVLGNAAVVDTYRYAGKPIFALPVTSVVGVPWNEAKDFARSRNRFLWLGSSSLVHKGLDIVLEAFASMPDLHLTVCGPIEAETEFCEVYRHELFSTSNIRVAGWVDVSSTQFHQIADECVAVVFCSCAEAQASSIVNCMRAGLVPVVTRQTGISVHDFGLEISTITVEALCAAIQQIARMSPDELASRARRTWEYAAAHHSQEAYAREYRGIVQQIIADAVHHKGTAG